MDAGRRATRNVALVYAFGFCMDFALWHGVWIKYLIDVRGLELRWILLMDMPFWLAVAALQVPAGALADRIGRRPVMALAGLTYAVTILGFGLTTNYPVLFVDYMLWAVALSLQYGADQALAYDSLAGAGRAGEFQRFAGRSLAIRLSGMTLGVALGGWLAEATSLAFAVQISALMPLAATGVALFTREPPMARRRVHYFAALREGVAFVWVRPQVRYTVLLGAALVVGSFGPIILAQPFLLEHDVGTGLFGVYQAPLKLASVAGAILAASLAARLGRGRLISLMVAAMLSAYAGLSFIQATPSFAFFALTSLAIGAGRPTVDTHLNERTPAELRATVLSVLSLAYALQLAFYEPALGFLADDVSLTAAFVLAAGYLTVTTTPLLVLWRRANATPAAGVAAGALPSVSPGG